jgi:hypothetical protein
MGKTVVLESRMARLARAFDDFDREHPEVYREFVKHASRLRSQGFRHYSARTIVEVLRFHSDLDGRDVDRFKINNNHTPYFVRKLEREDASFIGFFEKRALVSEAA